MVIVLAMVLVRSFGFFKMCLRASRNMHDRLFRGITRGWMSFFNTNPSGRILNRFSKDIDNIDTILPVALNDAVLVRNRYQKIIFIIYLVLVPLRDDRYHRPCVDVQLLAAFANAHHVRIILRIAFSICQYSTPGQTNRVIEYV